MVYWVLKHQLYHLVKSFIKRTCWAASIAYLVEHVTHILKDFSRHPHLSPPLPFPVCLSALISCQKSRLNCCKKFFCLFFNLKRTCCAHFFLHSFILYLHDSNLKIILVNPVWSINIAPQSHRLPETSCFMSQTESLMVRQVELLWDDHIRDILSLINWSSRSKS